jgi:branched-chain amino acid transport system substrate-binding protein
VVFLGSAIIEIVHAIKGIRKTGWDPVIGTVNTAETKYVQLLAKKSGITADGLYFAATTKAIRADNPDQSIRDWWNKYVEMNNQEPDLAEAWGYSAIYTFEKAAIKAGENLTREKLIEAFETFRDEKNAILGGLPLTFTPTDHLGTRACYVAQMKNGAYELISEVMSY